MTDFVFLVSPQELVSAAMVFAFMIAGLVACYAIYTWAMNMIENYGDDLEQWHITEIRDDSDRH